MKKLLSLIICLFAVIAVNSVNAQCPTITCPADITVNTDPGVCNAVVNFSTPTASNPCGTSIDTFSYSGSIVTWTVPAGVTSVRIDARGAQGGWNTSSVYQPGMGASMAGDFTVTPGQQLKILVGQQPSNGAGNGGGGGTFVTDISNNPLVVAGGGGGSSQGTDSPDKHGQVGTSGGVGSAGGGAGGTGGSGGGIGASGFQSGAGGGLLTNGADGWSAGTGGLAFVNGGSGGPSNVPANGGFGGGGSGSSYVVGGGGGGYSGGGSGGNSTAGVGGGGGSFNSGTNQVNTGGSNVGHGLVRILYNNGPVTLTQTAGLASGSTFPLGTSTITYVATDNLGNTANCSFQVTVSDVTAPVADLASLPNATGECSVTVSAAPTATDNCSGAITATTTDALTYSTLGTHTINWTYTDGNGNTSTQTQSVIVSDNTAPVADVTSLPNITGECSVNVTTAPTATDNCAGSITATTTDALSFTSLGTYTINWTYNDGNGNTSTQAQTVIVGDNTAPVADVASLPNITGECSVNVTSAPTATDNCAGTITATTTDALTFASLGTYTINWTYNDGNGNTSTQTQTVIVGDNTAPVADVASLPNITGECSVNVTTAPTATDNCAGTITATTTDALTYSTLGTYTINWTYNDGNGNTSTQAQTVIVNDNTAPVEDVPSLATVSGDCNVSVTTVPTATDNCAGVITATTTDALTYSTVGTHTITWSFNDGNGNTSNQTQTVIVTDNAAPVADVTSLPNVTGCSVSVTDIPTATDNCAGSVSATTTDALTYTVPGTYTITWTYNDGNGNTSTQTQQVDVTPVDTSVTVSGVTLTSNVTGASYEWLNCTLQTVIAGETNQSFTATANGNYAMIITVNGCSDTSSCYAVTSVGLSRISQQSITAYPNPTNGIINLEMDYISNTQMVVYNVIGEVVLEGRISTNHTEINLSGFESGIYYIALKSDAGSKMIKCVKN